MKHVSVIGAGTMGNGIAHHFALSGFSVSLIDISDAQMVRASQSIADNLNRQVKKELISLREKEETLKRINFSTSMEAVRKSELIIEATSENFKTKADVLKQLDMLALPAAIIATNTSSISVTKLASHLQNPSRFIGMHFMNPVPVMKLVEIITGYNTSRETTQKTFHLAESINKTPVVVNDYPGFISNRILMPMINEAIATVYEGVAGVNEVDTIMKLGMSHPMGPLQLADYIGLDICLSILNVLLEGFGNPKFAPCPLLVNMVNAGKLGVKSGEGFYFYKPGVKELVVSNRFLK